MSDRQLIADLLSALEYHTEQTRPIEFSKVAIEAAREHLRKPAQRTWVGLTRAECLQIEKDMMKYYDYQHECKTVCLPEFARAIEAKLKEKNT